MATDLGTLFYKLVLSQDEFDKSLDSADKKVEAFNKKLEKIGSELNKKVTLPILAVGTAALKFASDAETAGKKFEKAFAGSTDKANKAVEELNKSYGLATSTSTKLLANTGDLLKGFGATSDQALEVSTEVVKLSSALSAYSGVPAAEASEKLTKALLGETDGLVSLGIKLSQTDIQQELVRKGQENLTGQALLLAKAQITLELATKQSSDAIGSFADNQDSAAFQTQALLGDLKDLGVQFGNVLLPVAKDLVAGIRDVVEWFSGLSDTAKTTIVTVAAVAAGIGPLITAVKSLSVAITFLAANPIVAAIAAAASLTAILVGVNTALKDKAVKDASARFADLGTEIGVTGDQIVKIEKSLKGWDKVNLAGVKSWSKELGITEEQYLQIAIASSKVSESYKESARQALDQLTTVKQLSEVEDIRAEKAMIRAGQAGADQKKLEDQAAKDLAARVALEQQYLDARSKVKQIISDGLTEQEQLQSQINDLEKVRWAAGSKLEIDRLAAIKLLQDQITQLNVDEVAKAKATADAEAQIVADKAAKIVETEKKAKEERLSSITAVLEAAKTYNKTDLQLLQEKYNSIAAIELTSQDERAAQAEALIALSQQISDEQLAILEQQVIEEDKARTDKLAKEKAARDQMIQNVADIGAKTLEMANTINSIYQNLADAAIATGEAQIEANNLYYDQKIASAEEAADADGVRTAEEELAIKKLQNAKLEAEYNTELEIYKIEKDAFKRSQAIAYAEIAINTAIAIMKGYAQLGPIGGTISAIALAALGIAQGIAVYTKPAPAAPVAPTYLAAGGVASATPGGINTVIAEGGVDELVAPLNDKTFSALGGAIVDSMKGSSIGATAAGGLMNLTIILDGLGQVALQLTQEAMDNGIIRVPARIITQG